MRYVKRCPRCGEINDELEELCRQCGEFLGMVASVPEGAVQPEAPKPAPFPPPQSASAPPEAQAGVLYLEHASGSRWAVRQGQVVGQAWPQNGPDVPIEGLPGTR